MTRSGISDFFEDDDLFSTGEIFARRELLHIGHIPNRDRIVGRSDEIEKVGRAIGPAVTGGPPRNLMIYGKTGTGKSLVSRHVVRRAKSRASQNDVQLINVYLDCSDTDTETRITRQMALTVRDELDADIDIPRNGVGASTYYEYLWDLLDSVDVFVVILDEIDKIQDNDVLMQLSRAEESGKTSSYIGVISISNKIEYRERLNERINSSLQGREFVFHPYDATELQEILENRRDAFHDGVLQNGVIPKTAALAAREHGDARKAIDILYEAGAKAEDAGDSEVTIDHLDGAQKRAEIKRFQELVRGSTPHVKYVLRALAILTQENEADMFSTHEIYKMYERVTDQENVTTLSEDRVYRLLREQAFLGVTESNHTGGGRGEGSFLEHRLVREPEIIFDAIE